MSPSIAVVASFGKAAGLSLFTAGSISEMQFTLITRRILRTAAFLGIAAGATFASAQAQNSGAQAVALNATIPESLRLSLSANALNFSLAAGSAANPGNVTITATTAWVLRPGRAAVGLYAYFTNPAAALSDGAGNNIPSSAFRISSNGRPFRTLTRTVQFGALRAGLRLVNTVITSLNRSGTRTDVMAFNIDLSTGTLPQLPAGVYTGTLNIQAQAAP